MARIFCDVSVFGESWFTAALPELLSSEKIRVSYADNKKLNEEHERCLKAKQFYKLMGELRKRDDAASTEVDRHQSYLEGLQQWKGEKDCDDPHIFALAYEKPVKFVFSTDDDMANCRKCINKVVDSRYCGFKLISREANYVTHKHEIFA